MSTSDHLTSNVCDWTASKDNTTYDLVVYDATLLIVIGIYTVDDNASFTCGASGC